MAIGRSNGNSRAIVIGASSGIGRALAKVLAENGYAVGLAARRLPLLVELQQEIGSQSWTKQIDIADLPRAMTQLTELIDEMGGADLMVVSSGTGYLNPDLEWPPEEETLRVNVLGFAAMANVAMRHFLRRGAGHLVGISSVAAVRGSSHAPAYSASKAFMSNYLEGLRCRVRRLGLPIAITEIRPGFVDTPMAKAPVQLWVATPEEAARQIFRAIRRRSRQVYVTRRWRLVAWLLQGLPEWLYYRAR